MRPPRRIHFEEKAAEDKGGGGTQHENDLLQTADEAKTKADVDSAAAANAQELIIGERAKAMPPVKNPNLPLRLRTLNGFGALIEGSQYCSFLIEFPSIPLPYPSPLFPLLLLHLRHRIHSAD